MRLAAGLFWLNVPPLMFNWPTPVEKRPIEVVLRRGDCASRLIQPTLAVCADLQVLDWRSNCRWIVICSLGVGTGGVISTDTISPPPDMSAEGFPRFD